MHCISIDLEKAYDRVISIQKFINHQLRSRSYKIKLSEIFPINSDVLEIDGTIRGLTVNNDSDSDDSILPALDNIFPVVSTPSTANNFSSP